MCIRDRALLALDLFGVIIYSIDGAVATLVDAAQRLLLQRGDAAGLVARRGVALADIFADSVEVRLKAAGDLIDAIVDFLVDSTAGQNVLSANAVSYTHLDVYKRQAPV